MAHFTHLHTHSHYSLLDGLPKINDLVARAKELGMGSIALTDHGNLYGAIEFYKAAKKAGIKPIFGVEAYIDPGPHDDKYFHLVLLAENTAGWKNLVKLVTKGFLENFYYKPRIKKEWLREHHKGLIALSACLGGEIQRLLSRDQYEAAKKAALEYQDIFGTGNYFLEFGHHPGIKDTLKPQEGLLRIHRETSIPRVATQDIHYLRPEDAKYHDILLAVQTGNKLSDGDRLTLNEDDFSMRSPEEMARLFADTPDAIENAAKIADRCNVSLTLGKNQLPYFEVPAGETPMGFLRELVTERVPERYKEITPPIQARIDFELATVEKMGFADYFLIVQDLVTWAKDRGIAVGPGRGSAAGSIVSYILRITDIDPLKYDLLFERFLNPDRIQMPDIDIDISDRRRDEVFGHLVEKYGEDKVAHIITFGTMAARASVRDVGRALGVGLAFCDKLAKLIPFGMDLDEALKTPELAALVRSSEDAQKIIDAAAHLEGVARHASMHACGIVISKDPLVEQIPLQRSPKDERLIMSQFEMHALEDLGILKMDLLGLRNLTIIEDAVRLIEERRGQGFDIGTLPLDDAPTFKLLSEANTVGVFQLESSGMRRYLKELKPTELEDIIAMISLYRPGPMDLIPSYLNRKYGREKVTYLHPRLEPILKNTYGVGVYQEQMMRIASDLAGFTLAQADTLRKAIGKKIKSLLDEQETLLITGMVKNGIEPRTARLIWELFPPFARYGFNRSHSACYALLAYQTAYLKANYPVEFMTALLNAESTEIERTAFLITETKKMNIDILPPDVNASREYFIAESETTIRFGLAAIKNVGLPIVGAIIAERERGGAFDTLASFFHRVTHKDLNKKSIENLAKAGVFDSLRVERNTVLANMDEILKFTGGLKKSVGNQMGLFASGPSKRALGFKPAPPATPQEKLLWEKELLGLFLSDHPLNHHAERIAKNGSRPIRDILHDPGMGGMHKICGIITKLKKILTKKGDPMLFVRVEDRGGGVEVLVFADTLKRTADLWQENAVVEIEGRLSERDGESKLICNSARPLIRES